MIEPFTWGSNPKLSNGCERSFNTRNASKEAILELAAENVHFQRNIFDFLNWLVRNTSQTFRLIYISGGLPVEKREWMNEWMNV